MGNQFKFANLNNVWVADEKELRRIAKHDPDISYDDAKNLDEMSLKIALLENRQKMNEMIINSVIREEGGFKEDHK